MNDPDFHKISFSTLSPADLPQIRFISATHLQLPCEWIPHYIPEVAAIDLEAEKLRCSIATKEAVVFVAKDMDELIIGYSWMEKLKQDSVGCCLSRSLWVAHGLRRRGIAASLKDMAKRWALDEGMHTIMTSVSPGNTGIIALNKSLGYDVTQLVMELKLSLL